MMLSLLLVASCAREPITVTSCPPFPWPGDKVIDVLEEQGKARADVGHWITDLFKHGAECDELNGQAD